MPSSNISYAPNNCITINHSGTYEINYSSFVSADYDATVTLSVLQNGTSIPCTQITRKMQKNTETVFNRTIFCELNAGDVISIALSAPSSASTQLNTDVTAVLTLKKINLQ